MSSVKNTQHHCQILNTQSIMHIRIKQKRLFDISFVWFVQVPFKHQCTHWIKYIHCTCLKKCFSQASVIDATNDSSIEGQALGMLKKWCRNVFTEF